MEVLVEDMVDTEVMEVHMSNSWEHYMVWSKEPNFYICLIFQDMEVMVVMVGMEEDTGATALEDESFYF